MLWHDLKSKAWTWRTNQPTHILRIRNLKRKGTAISHFTIFIVTCLKFGLKNKGICTWDGSVKIHLKQSQNVPKWLPFLPETWMIGGVEQRWLLLARKKVRKKRGRWLVSLAGADARRWPRLVGHPHLLLLLAIISSSFRRLLALVSLDFCYHWSHLVAVVLLLLW